MSQSYGNSSNSTITAATDAVLGISLVEQDLGSSLSGVNPASSVTSGLTLTIKLDQETSAQTIVLALNDNVYNIAADIQAKVRVLTPLGFASPSAFTLFTARYDDNLKKLVLTSGTATTDLVNTAVAVTGGTAALALKLGAANGGTESKTGAEVITYTVNYRFVYGAGASFGSFPVVVNSSEVATPTNISQVMTLANERASQIKAQASSSAYVTSDNQSQNGPVVL